MERAVGIDEGVVAGDRVADAVDGAIGGGRLLLVAVVAEGPDPTHTEHADLARTLRERLPVLVEHDATVADLKHRGLGIVARHRDGGPERAAFARAQHVEQHHLAPLEERPGSSGAARHHPRCPRSVAATRGRTGGLRRRRAPGPPQRPCESVAHDDELVDVLGSHEPEHLVGVEPTALEQHDRAALQERRHRQEQRRAVHQRRAAERDRSAPELADLDRRRADLRWFARDR